MRLSLLTVLGLIALAAGGCVFSRNIGLCALPERNLNEGGITQFLWTRSKIYIPRDGADPSLVGLAPRLYLINIDPATGQPRLMAYSVLNGGELWRQPAQLGDSVLTTNAAIYKGAVDQIQEYDPQTGRQLRRVPVPSVRTINLVNWDGHNILAFAPGSGRSVIYNPRAGTVEVSKRLLAYIPSMLEENVLYLADAEGFKATDKMTGNVLWTYPIGEQLTQHALLSSTKVILQASSGNIYAIDKKTGDLIWKLADSKSVSNLAQDDRRLFFLTSNGSLEILDIGTGQELQSLRLSTTPFAVRPLEVRIGRYDLWFDTPDRILIGSLGDSCQLFAMRLPQ